MEPGDRFPNRRDVLTATLASAAFVPTQPQESRAQETPREVYLERVAEGTPHKGKVLLAVQAHSDDIPLSAAGTVAKLVKEGYTGYLLRATNDDMGDAPGLGTPGSIGDHVLGNERDNAEVARVLGLKKVFDLNYSNHRMADVSQNELQCRLIFLIRLLKVDTVVCWDPWGHDEENPDHTQIARGVEAASWMAGRAHDYPEQLDQPRRGRERGSRANHRRQPREPGQRAGRKSRLATPGRAGQARPKTPAPRRRRRHCRPQLHQRVPPRPPPCPGPETRRPVCGGVPLHRRQLAPFCRGRIHQEQSRSA